MMIFRVCGCVLGFLLMFSGANFAEELGDIETDRPDFTETATVVPQGYVQLESGLSMQADDSARNATLGELLLRFDTPIPNIEGRLGVPNYHMDRSEDAYSQGFDDVSLGLKMVLLSPKAGKAAAGIFTVYIPSGSEGYIRQAVEPEAKLCLSADLPHDLKLGSNMGLSLATNESRSFIKPFMTLVFGQSWTEKWGSYVEWFGTFQSGAGENDRHILDGGITYLWNADTQVDVRGGFGLSGRADDYFFGIGFSKRARFY